MSREITLELPDEVLDRAEAFARLTSRDVEEVLSQTLESVLSSAPSAMTDGPPVSQLSDAEVLETAASMLDPKTQQRLSTLLYEQQAGTLDEDGFTELDRLMAVYEKGLLRKSQALVEAVQRGLREPLSGGPAEGFPRSESEFAQLPASGAGTAWLARSTSTASSRSNTSSRRLEGVATTSPICGSPASSPTVTKGSRWTPSIR